MSAPGLITDTMVDPRNVPDVSDEDPVAEVEEHSLEEEEADREMRLKIIKILADVVETEAQSDAIEWSMGSFKHKFTKNSCIFYCDNIGRLMNAKIRVATGYGGTRISDYLGPYEYKESYPSYQIRLQLKKQLVLEIKFKNDFEIKLDDDIDPIVEQMCRQWRLNPADGWFDKTDGSPL